MSDTFLSPTETLTITQCHHSNALAPAMEQITDDCPASAAYSTMLPPKALSEAAGPPVDISKLSHLRAWQTAVAHYPNDIALISNDQRIKDCSWLDRWTDHDSTLQCTFADLDRSSRRLATALNRLTPIQQRPIAVLLDNQAEWLLFFWAAAYLHSPLVPINPKCAARSEEITHMLRTVQPAVLVATDQEVMRQLQHNVDEKALVDIQLKIVVDRVSVEPSFGAWQSLHDVLHRDLTPPDTPVFADPLESAVILFTSGTTALPKPCAISSARTAHAAFVYQHPRHITFGQRLISHLANFHSYGIGWVLAFLLVGGTVIIPSRSFEAQASLECIEKYAATHMSLVPTTAQTMIAHPAFANTNVTTLTTIDISGAGILPGVIENCESAFNIPVGTSYGMTESPTTLIWPTDEGRAVRCSQVLSGRPTLGARVKVCEPGTRNIVPHGEAGELHNGGVQVINCYLNANVPSDAFYTDDDGCAWLITGDQAIMEEDGAVRICGRYKELIIRGGENISPASIESCLQSAPEVYMVHVVGTPDELAGEVPIAVVQPVQGSQFHANKLKVMASNSLGAAFAPKMVLHLKVDLQLDSFPTTAAGKVRKVELAEIVRSYMEMRKATAIDLSAPTIQSLILIWQRISGNDELTAGTTIQSFADSLMMMQLSSIVKRELNRDIMVEDFKLCETIQAQADLIDSRPSRTTVIPQPELSGPPQMKDVVHVRDDSSAYIHMKTQICSVLDNHGLDWENVDGISPLPDWDAVFAMRSRPQSWNLRWSYHSRVSSKRLEAALRKILSAHHTLRSIAVQTDHELPLLVSMRPNEQWFNAAWTTGHQLENAKDLDNLFLDDPILDSAIIGGPMFRFHIASISKDDSSGVAIVASHAVCDMSMTKLWMDDLVTALSGEDSITPHVSFHDYAAAYHNHRHGTDANNGVNYWTHKLQGIGALPETTFWPQQRSPEFFKGNDVGWCRLNGRTALPYEREVSLVTKRAAQIGIRRLVCIEDIAWLKSEHNVPVFMLVKAAIAIMNVKRTGAQEAVFGTLNAARKWPFSADYSADEQHTYTGNPLDISGCTTEYVLDRINVQLHENIVHFMQQVTEDEDNNSAFAKTPVLRIIDSLRQPLSTADTRTWLARERDADAVLTNIRRQSFNWLPTAPTAQSSEEGLRMLQLLTRMDNGLTITGFLADDKRSIVLAFTWDAEHLTMQEAEDALACLANLVQVMSQISNSDKTVADVMAP